MLQIDRITDLNGLKALERDWNGLLAEATYDGYVHLTFDWLYSWARTIGTKDRPYVLRVRDGQTVLGIAPFNLRTITLKKVIPFRQLTFLGDPESDFGDIIVNDRREEVIRAIEQYLIRRSDWGEILLRDIPETTPTFPLLRNLFVGSGFETQIKRLTACYHIRIAGRTWDEYYATTSKGFVQKDIRRMNNHYGQLSWRTQVFEGEEIDPMLSAMTALHESSQERKQRTSAFQQEEFRRFLLTVFASAPSIRPQLHVMFIDEIPAAYMLGYEYDRVFYWWSTGFNPDFHKFSPTKYLLYTKLRTFFERQELREFNFMRGETDYKRRWTSDTYDLYQLRVWNRRGIHGLVNRFRSIGVADDAAGSPAVEAPTEVAEEM